MARLGKPGGIPSLSKPAQPAASVKPVVQSTKPSSAPADDDWQTDPDSVNVASSKKEQRFGHAAGKGSINLTELRQSAVAEHETSQKTRDQANAFSRGYGGKFGLEADRTDASTNRPGSAATDTKSKNKQPAKVADAKYESAESYKAGYGGKFGVQSDRFDSSAHRFDDEPVAGAGKTSQHSSVTDFKKGYGGAFGVQKDRQDKSAHGFDERDDSRENEPKPGAKVADAKYGSAQDYKKGYGGEFGVQIDRFDKNAAGFDDKDGAEPTPGSRPRKPSLPKPTTTGDNRAKNLRSFFENINSVKAEEASKTSAAAVQNRRDFEQSVFDREKKRNEDKKVAEAAQREAEKKAAPAPAKAPEPVVPAYVPPPQPAPVKVEPPPQPAYVPPPAPAPAPELEEVKAPEPEPEPQPAFASYEYTKPEPVPEPTPEPEAAPVQQFGQLRVEDVEPPQPEADTSLYANVEVARRSAAEPAPAAGEPAFGADGSAPQTLFVAEAIYDYEATAEDELAFRAGDRINVIQKVDPGTEGWWLGECGGRTGLFPANYVKTEDQ